MKRLSTRQLTLTARLGDLGPLAILQKNAGPIALAMAPSASCYGRKDSLLRTASRVFSISSR